MTETSPWVDRREAIAPGTPCTHALVIGTSSYAFLDNEDAGRLGIGLAQTQTPATGAYRFAEWLRDEYRAPHAPLATVRLLLEPAPGEFAEEELGPSTVVPNTSRAAVQQALLEWKQGCRNDPDGVAILYLSGHGIALSRSEMNVLLADFGRDENIMDYSVNVARVYEGMAGENLPQVQLYFVDACRIQPKTYTALRFAGRGVGLDADWDGEDKRAAPIFFGAAPNGQAFGVLVSDESPTGGTLFSQALLNCLSGAGASDSVDDSGEWRVTTTSLLRAMQYVVEGLSRTYGVDQTFYGGGQNREADVHVFEDAPEFAVEIEFEPASGHTVAWADLWTWDRMRSILRDATFSSPRTTWMLPGGSYSLDVAIRPPLPTLRGRSGIALISQPRLRHIRRKIPLTAP